MWHHYFFKLTSFKSCVEPTSSFNKVLIAGVPQGYSRLVNWEVKEP
jgi:hypothetical protein